MVAANTLYILFNQKTLSKHGLSRIQGNLHILNVVLLVFNVSILAARVIDRSCGILLIFSVILDRQGVKQKKDRAGWEGDYSRAAIISNILTKMGRLFKGDD